MDRMFKDLSSIAQSAASNVRGSTTKELLQKIEAQDNELLKYKKRTRDLVVSYKTVLDEKTKLQKTLETLTKPQVQETAEDNLWGDLDEKSNKTNETKDQNNTQINETKQNVKKRVRKRRKKVPENKTLPESRNGSIDNDIQTDQNKSSEYESYSSSENEQTDNLTNEDFKKAIEQGIQKGRLLANQTNQVQIKALTSQLSESMSQATKLKDTFLTDKKIMKADYESKISKLNSEINIANTNFQQTSEQLNSIKEQFREQSKELEKEKDSSNKYRRENQNAVVNYRKQIQDLEERLDKEKNLSSKVLSDQEKSSASNLANETMINQYKNKVEELSVKLTAAEEKLSTPDQTLVTKIKNLSSEVDFLKKQNNDKSKLFTDQKQILEEKLSSNIKQEQTTRASLELKINELSKNIGLVEKKRQKDQELIAQLRERTNVLDLENLNLLSKVKENKQLSTEELPKLMLEIVEKDRNVTNCFTGMLICVRKAINEEVSLSSIIQVFPEVKTVYDKQIQQLKEEIQNLTLELNFANSKRSDSLLSRINTPSSLTNSITSNSSTILTSDENLKAQNQQFAQKIDSLKAQLDTLNITNKNEISQLQLDFDNQIREINQEWRKQINNLEKELVSQRERSLVTLNDKDRELQQLRSQLYSSPPSTPDISLTNSISGQLNSLGVDEELYEKIQNTLNISMIHYSEKLARIDVELATLRQQNKELTKRIKGLQDKICLMDENFNKDINEYKTRIASAINPSTSQNNKNDSKNEDYIKNVLFNYLIMPYKAKGRFQMMQALAAALHFTGEELSKIKTIQKL